MSQQSTASKPSLSGVKIKARKRAVQASAKHEPAVFRDQLYKHLETIPEGDFDGYYNKLVQAGSTLEFLKYADAFYEIFFTGGLLQPGGQYVQDGAPPSPFSILKARDPPQVEDIKKYIDVLNKLVRRYKYLQRPLEETSLPGLFQYCNRWPAEQRDKFAIATGLIMAQGLSTSAPLLSLAKDHLVKDFLALNVLTVIFRTYLVDQTMEHLNSTLRKGGVKNILLFLPANKRDAKTLEDHFKKAGLPQVAEWFIRKQSAAARESVVKTLKELCEDENRSTDEIVEALKSSQEEQPIPATDFVGCIWQGLTGIIDWSTRADQIEAVVLREVDKYAPVLEPFCESAKTQVALINAVQVYAYEETRVMKTFPQILKILYNKDCISAQAIIYWHQKGAKPQGKQHFLKATEALVKFLEAQEDESDEEEE
ncbi:ARM repeat-containing protein [Fomitiporia mediterranea MF3/22]|uniref:ARM repeat-containing protein n=1 Tax=Fomitiporia mediterranea (strain MF3/22) TaxID=694068 RepID=UPI0004407810|nr:ARM repeat-containing protein [Fomitiporia mediterranea MF3/22]EJD03046.1 ARM repeat-containing protein [Fomitiporia mediterranea MF3/22]